MGRCAREAARRAARSGGLALLAAVGLAAGCSEPPAGPRPSVLLVTVDTLRADYLEPYGFAAPTSPALAALAREAVVFERAIASSSLTAPSIASLMTSRYPRQHSIGTVNGATALSGIETLAERFREGGYATAAFVSNVVLARRSGLARGFEHYDDELPELERNRPAFRERDAAGTVARAVEWLAQPRERPFFVWVHLQDPHGPYQPPDESLSRIPELRLPVDRELPRLERQVGRGGIPAYQALPGERHSSAYARRYAGEIAYADSWLEPLLAAARSAAKELVWLFTADHGESLGEGGFFFQHGHAATPELARVPLLLSAPGLTPGRVDAVAAHVDIAPTLLELAGLPTLEDARGRSLLALARGESPARLVFCEAPGEVAAYGEGGFLRAGGWPPVPGGFASWPGAGGLAIQGFRGQGRELRRAELPGLDPEEVRRYLASEHPVAEAGGFDPEETERLRALGYLPPEEDGPR